jgi:V/A-type H+-transporting ATPase subunit D
MRNLAPTKSNLLSVQDELKFAKLGYELLDQKRNILVLELLNLVDQASDFEEKVEHSLASAYAALQDATLDMGRLRVQQLSRAVNMSCDINLKDRRVMGVQLPVVQTQFDDQPPYYSPSETSFRVDGAMQGFKEALELMGRLAELKISIMRLATEVKKTIRKVNALEKIAIPDLNETVDFIRNRLEENERDMFILMKMVKERLERKKEETSHDGNS